MTTKYDIGEEITLKDISFVVLEIRIGDKGWVRYKIGIRRHTIDSQGYPDNYIIGEFYADDDLLSKAVKGVTFW